MGIFQWRLAGCKYVWRLIILEGTIATVHRLFVATVLDRFQRVDQRTGIETAQPGERLAEHLVGQCFQTADTESLDLASELVGIRELLLRCSGPVGSVAMAIAIGRDRAWR